MEKRLDDDFVQRVLGEDEVQAIGVLEVLNEEGDFVQDVLG